MKPCTYLAAPTSLVIVIMVLLFIFDREVGLPPQCTGQCQKTSTAANGWDGWRLQAWGVRSKRHGQTMSMWQMLGLELLLLWKMKHRYWICSGKWGLSDWFCTSNLTDQINPYIPYMGWSHTDQPMYQLSQKSWHFKNIRMFGCNTICKFQAEVTTKIIKKKKKDFFQF